MRFTDEAEHRQAMIDMQGAVGCGLKPLRVSAATPKRYTKFLFNLVCLFTFATTPSNTFSFSQYSYTIKF